MIGSRKTRPAVGGDVTKKVKPGVVVRPWAWLVSRDKLLIFTNKRQVSPIQILTKQKFAFALVSQL